ncbi:MULTISPECIES: hypothetical protein [Nostocales]|uniref:WD40 repeat-containing protein n=2 Tax=Nostocales TaxID=1161 RepID=A0ABW8XMJ4_9CYAN
MVQTLHGLSGSPQGNSCASRVYAMAFSPNAKTITSTSTDKTTILWN